MSKVISDALQTVVRASQLGDVIVSVKRPSITVNFGGAPFFTVILNIDVATISLTLLATRTHTLQNFNHNESPTITRTISFPAGGDVTAAVEGTFAIEATPTYTFVATPDQENLLSNMGSFMALDAVPSFDVT